MRGKTVKRILFVALSMLLFTMIFSSCAQNSTKTEIEGRNTDPQNGFPESGKVERTRNIETVEYSYQYANMKLELPVEWEYKIMTGEGDADNSTTNEYANNFGIRFWPKAQPSMTIDFRYHANGIGLCGTGVTFEDISFKNGLTATKCTEGTNNSYWFFLIYRDVPGDYAVECYTSKDLWSQYESTIMSILESVEIGKNILSETEAIEIAKVECTVSYDTVRTHFDYTNGVWQIHFSTNDLSGADQIIWIDAQGDIQNTQYGE